MRSILTRLRAKRRNTSYEPGEDFQGVRGVLGKIKGACGRLRRTSTVSFFFFLNSVCLSWRKATIGCTLDRGKLKKKKINKKIKQEAEEAIPKMRLLQSILMDVKQVRRQQVFSEEEGVKQVVGSSNCLSHTIGKYPVTIKQVRLAHARLVYFFLFLVFGMLFKITVLPRTNLAKEMFLGCYLSYWLTFKMMAFQCKSLIS